jgi:tetraacyldisaccharide 4'-kinase
MPGKWLSQIRNYLFDKRYLNIKRAPCAVMSIGNLTWGGTGKTALVCQIASYLLQRKLNVAILSRGYGRESRGVQLVCDGREVLLDWKQAGDESHMLAQALRSAVVVVAEDRAAGIDFLQQFDPDVILMDDAFQHRSVARDLDLVLIDASEDLLKKYVLPFGKLREPVRALKRADAIVLTHCRRAEKRTEDWIAKNISAPLFHADYAPSSNQSFQGKKVAAFCAIGAPHHFFEMLQDSGASLVFTKRYRDHHAYFSDELTRIEVEALNAGAEIIVTTRKDAVKIDPRVFRTPFFIVDAQLKIREQDVFHQLLASKVPVNRKHEISG